MGESEDSKFASGHPVIYRCIAFVLVGLMSVLVGYCQAYQRGDFRQPEVHLESQVDDTGVYMSQDESLFERSGKLSCYGKHLVLITRLTPLEMGNVNFDQMYGRHWYGLATDYDNPKRSFVVLSDEELPDADLNTYLEVDGIVSGYLLRPTDRKSGVASVSYPILKISSIRRGTLLDLVSSVVSEVKPNLSTSEAGITLTLDVITYRDKLAVAQMSLKNDTERYVNAKGLVVARGDGSLVYTHRNPVTYGQYFADDASGEHAFFGAGPLIGPGESFTATCPLDPVDPHESLKFTVSLNATTGEIRDGLPELDVHELEITYEPEVGE